MRGLHHPKHAGIPAAADEAAAVSRGPHIAMDFTIDGQTVAELQAACRPRNCRPLSSARRQQAFEETEVVSQRPLFTFQLARLLDQLSLRRALGPDTLSAESGTDFVASCSGRGREPEHHRQRCSAQKPG